MTTCTNLVTARAAALEVVDLWGAPVEVRAYLETGEGQTGAMAAMRAFCTADRNTQLSTGYFQMATWNCIRNQRLGEVAESVTIGKRLAAEGR
jgi:hypothetical protein